MDDLPYELIEIIGRNDWKGLIHAALTCKAWYLYISRFPWHLFTPFYKKWSDDVGNGFSRMSMFGMLLRNNRVYDEWYNSDYYDDKLSRYNDKKRDRIVAELRKNRETDIIIVGGIPIMILTDEEALMEYSTDDEYKEEIIKKWDLKALGSNRMNLDIRSITLPDIVRRVLLTNSLYEKWYTPEDPLEKSHRDSIGANFIQTHLVFNYTGITDHCVIDGVLQFVSHDMLYLLDLDKGCEISRHKLDEAGLKFFGFDDSGTIVPCTLLVDGQIKMFTKLLDNVSLSRDESYDREGWYILNHNIASNQRRVNVNRLNPIASFWLESIPVYNKMQAICDEDEDVINPLLYDKKGEDPDQNPYQLLGYTAGFWEEDFVEKPLPSNLLVDSTFDRIIEEVLHERYEHQRSRDSNLSDIARDLLGDTDHEPLSILLSAIEESTVEGNPNTDRENDMKEDAQIINGLKSDLIVSTPAYLFKKRTDMHWRLNDDSDDELSDDSQ